MSGIPARHYYRSLSTCLTVVAHTCDWCPAPLLLLAVAPLNIWDDDVTLSGEANEEKRSRENNLIWDMYSDVVDSGTTSDVQYILLLLT